MKLSWLRSASSKRRKSMGGKALQDGTPEWTTAATGLTLPGSDNDLPESAVHEFRRSVQEPSKRPEAFWDLQCETVMNRIAGGGLVRSRRATLAWIAAATTVIIAVGILIDRTPAVPAPDFAAGYDQELLTDVERSVARDVPLALDAAFLLVEEMERGNPDLRRR